MEKKTICMPNGEIIKNSFICPVSRSKGLDFSDDIVEEYELVDHYIPGPSGDSSDFVIEKRPTLTKKYHLNKVIKERASGCSLKEIIATITKTGDDTILTSRPVSYGDGTIIPQTLSDACDLASKGADLLDSASKEEIELAVKLSKMNEKEFQAYFKDLVDSKIKKPVVEDKGGNTDGE